MSRRDRAIVAWHEVPKDSVTPKGRPVGYGVTSAGVGTDSMDRSDEKCHGRRCDRSLARSAWEKRHPKRAVP